VLVVLAVERPFAAATPGWAGSIDVEIVPLGENDDLVATPWPEVHR
jgi:hypothetical protein